MQRGVILTDNVLEQCAMVSRKIHTNPYLAHDFLLYRLLGKF